MISFLAAKIRFYTEVLITIFSNNSHPLDTPVDGLDRHSVGHRHEITHNLNFTVKNNNSFTMNSVVLNFSKSFTL